MNLLPDLNDLVREAFGAQEAFDNWDEGKTFYGGVFGGPRACTLRDVDEELDAANLKLVNFIAEHATALRDALASGMEAPSGGETAQTGSTEGDSPTRSEAEGDAQ